MCIIFQVYVASMLDREKQAEYTLTVTVTDGKFTANTTVTITVIDVNGEYFVFSVNCDTFIYKHTM